MTNPPAPWTLSIDKIAMVHYDQNEARVESVCASLVDQIRTGQFVGGILTGHRRFKVQLSIPVPGTSGRVLIQAGPRGKNQCAYRIEINPALVGSSGVRYLIEFLDRIFDQGGEQLLRDSVITRIDIALDILGLTANQVIARSRKSQAHGVFSDRAGIPANIYFGRPKNNNATVYTRIAGKGEPYLRTEKRMIPKLRGSHLGALKNPFASLQLVHIDSLLPHLSGLNPDHLFDSIRVRGFTHVLQGLESDRRRSLDAVLKNLDHSLLPSMDEIWLRWPDTLVASGLGFLAGDSLIAHPPAGTSWNSRAVERVGEP